MKKSAILVLGGIVLCLLLPKPLFSIPSKAHPSEFCQSDSLRQNLDDMLKQRSQSVVFEQNKGQWDANILYRAEGSKGFFSIMKDGISITFFTKEEGTDQDDSLAEAGAGVTERLSRVDAARLRNEHTKEARLKGQASEPYPPQAESPSNLNPWVWNYRFKGIQKGGSIVHKERVEQAGYRNYFSGVQVISQCDSYKEIFY